jgi:hypothetical protein
MLGLLDYPLLVALLLGKTIPRYGQQSGGTVACEQQIQELTSSFLSWIGLQSNFDRCTQGTKLSVADLIGRFVFGQFFREPPALNSGIRIQQKAAQVCDKGITIGLLTGLVCQGSSASAVGLLVAVDTGNVNAGSEGPKRVPAATKADPKNQRQLASLESLSSHFCHCPRGCCLESS